MKRHNRVILDGLIQSVRTEVRRVGGEAVPAVHFQVATDAPEMGGVHPAVAYGRLAAEVVIFAEAASEHNAPLEVTLDGWLRTVWRGDVPASAVVAERVTFHLPSEVRAAAVARLSALLNGEGGIHAMG